jgi:glycosyltransferase involved in cell wall biosynthesis
MAAPTGPLFVVVPCLDEETGITATLDALAAQTYEDFTLVLVDNGSTDGTRAVIARFQADHPGMRIELVDEPQKGTGAAADTGFRHAIARGAWAILRTDADCVPDPGWVENARAALAPGRLDFVAGRIRPRDDDHQLRLSDRVVIPALVTVASGFGKIRPANLGRQYHGGYMMVAGNNLAIRAGLYEECGGFPRTRIEDVHEDRALINRVRTVTNRYGKCREMVVYNSIRRARAYGYTRTLLWYWDHKYRPENVDVR